MQNYFFRLEKKIFFNYLIAIIVIFSFVFSIFNFTLKEVKASDVNFQIEIFYAKETYYIDTTLPFLETLLNPNGSNLKMSGPADVLESGEELWLTMYSTPKESVTPTKPLPADKLGADIFYNASFRKVSDDSPVILFDKPITLTFNYTNSEISGINEDTLAVYRWNGSNWVILSDSAIDTDLNKITASTQEFQFNDFALLGDAPISCGDGSCNGSEDCSSCPVDCGSCPGSGGGNVYIYSVTSVTFSGRAYPKSTITLLKDAQIAVVTIADPNANFSLGLSGLSSGNYIFSIYSEDSKGNRSSLVTIPISLTFGATTNIGGIFLAPTIALDKSEVKKGDNIAIFGQSVPYSEIIISINSNEEIFDKVKSDKNGIYLYNFDTTPLNLGQHFTKSKAAIDGNISPFSKAVSFIVNKKNIFTQSGKRYKKGDVNLDGRVNLVDFSILAYWYKKSLSPENIDLNSDGKVDLIDFSIMVFYWTG